jgi:hypothetical protein
MSRWPQLWLEAPVCAFRLRLSLLLENLALRQHLTMWRIPEIGRVVLLGVLVIDGRPHEISRVNGGANDLFQCWRVVELTDAVFGEHPS